MLLLYNVSRLSDRINEFIKIYIQVGDDNKLIDRLEDIADRLMPFVTKNGNHKTAKVFVERGSKYLESKNPSFRKSSGILS